MDQRPRSISDLVRRAERCSGVAVLSLLLVGLASTAAAAETESAAKEWDLGLAQSGGALKRGLFGWLSGDPPPWAVVAPGAARARFGLGLDTFFERQESLRIASMESAITVRDLVRGGVESGVLHGDPGLLNRKFDIVWEMKGAGVEFPIALARLGRFTYSTLVLQAATADVTLDFLDRTRAQDSSSLGGRGTLWGAGLNVIAAPSPSCPWFIESSYGFQKLPRFTVDRSPHFGPESFEVLDDEVRLGREVQEFAIRTGYGFSGNRVTAYTGVLHRRTDLELEDGLRYQDPLRATETHLASRTKLESDAILVLAGVDYALGPRLFSRLETSVGEGDWGVVLKVVYFPKAQREEPFDFTQFAASVAPQLAQLETEFRERRGRLTVVPAGEGETAYLTAEVKELLDWTERRLFEILHPRELAPLRDSIRWRFRRFRRDLGLIPPAETGGNSISSARAGIALAAFRLAQAGPGKSGRRREDDLVLDDIGDLLLRLLGFANEDRFTLKLCVVSDPPGAKFRMQSPEGSEPVRSWDTVDIRKIAIGRYFFKIQYEVKALQRRFPVPIQCGWDRRGNERDHGGDEDECLDLYQSQGDQLLICNFDRDRESCRPTDLPDPPPKGCLPE